MGSHYRLHLEQFPWPVSVLNFNRTLDAMQPGDDLIATMLDPDVVGNLRQLLGSQPGLRYTVWLTEAEYRIQVIKG